MISTSLITLGRVSPVSAVPTWSQLGDRGLSASGSLEASRALGASCAGKSVSVHQHPHPPVVFGAGGVTSPRGLKRDTRLSQRAYHQFDKHMYPRGLYRDTRFSKRDYQLLDNPLTEGQSWLRSGHLVTSSVMIKRTIFVTASISCLAVPSSSAVPSSFP